jgi:nitrite reductase/ring-hydroxylating ferredoxin subunit
MDDDSLVAAVEDVPEDSTSLFTVEVVGGDGDDDGGAGGGPGGAEAGEEKEAILVRLDGAVTCWLNYCQHLTHIKLDKGTGAPIRDGEIVCTNHGAMFESDTGLCTFGPCEGAYLNEVEVTVEDGDVYLTDPDFEFLREGPIEGNAFDLSSTSNVEF